ncbi:cytochrome b561 [Galendromus occidentalis]|uniref:Cytochrome b561 n=1 Tax=Galendromus occidentalis TaxID=34638 RepID=A0AAJ6QR65_9ACAR|nr:cytochrome b561 [Galendromus occidentalis]
MELSEEPVAGERLPGLKWLLYAAQLLGALSLILIAVMGALFGGYTGPSDPKKWFNWHPLLMTLGLLLLQGESIIIYRVLRNKPKFQLKIVHAALHAIAFALMVVSLQAVFDSHNLANPPYANMYSLHSWIGLGACILFAAQLLFGFLAFLFPQLRESRRKKLMPFHTFGGIVIFHLTIMATLMGITEKLIFARNYSALEAPALVGNVFGVSITLFSIVVFYIVSQPDYKRVPLPIDS